jgi:uncharacterized membrane-anchored protein
MRYHSALAPIRTLIGALLLGLALPLVAADSDKTPAVAPEQKAPAEKFAWQDGPAEGDLGGRAKLKVPAGFRFLGASDAARLMSLMGNQPSGNEIGFVRNEKSGWAVIFEFSDVGYVKDDDKDKLDAKKLLASIKKGNEAGNEYRRKNGLDPIDVIGWHVEPRYNDKTKNLEWSVLAESRGRRIVNYNVRLLGRNGITEATLMEDFDQVDASLPAFRDLLDHFNYKTGESYSEFKAGDKISEYGLSALILGGAAAVGYKVGFFGMVLAAFKKFAKVIIAGIVALVAGIRKFFGNLFGGRRPPSDGSSTDS